MKEYFHIDLSTQFSKKGNTGIACLRLPSKRHKGCALNNRIKRYIEKTLFLKANLRKEYAKLHAICIYFLIEEELEEIEKLVVCNDEDFLVVKLCLEKLLKTENKIEMISITEFRKQLLRKVQSPADNYARHYAKRALKVHKWHKGISLNVVQINYNMIKQKWELLKNA